MGISHEEFTKLPLKTHVLNKKRKILMDCKYCKEPLNADAKKCAKCRSSQNFFSNFDSIIRLALMFFLFFNPYSRNGLYDPKFQNINKSFSHNFVNESLGEKKNILNYEIKNTTKYEWDSIRYQLIGYDENDKIKLAISGSDYDWFIGINSTSIFSVKLEKNLQVKKWELIIKDLDFIDR